MAKLKESSSGIFYYLVTDYLESTHLTKSAKPLRYLYQTIKHTTKKQVSAPTEWSNKVVHNEHLQSR